MKAHDKRTVYQDNKTSAGKSGAGKAGEKPQPYTDRTGVSGVSTVPADASYRTQSMAFPCGDCATGFFSDRVLCEGGDQCAASV